MVKPRIRSAFSAPRKEDQLMRIHSQGAEPKQEAADDEFIGGLYGDHYEFLIRYVKKIGRVDLATAEDVVQEVFLRAWRNADRLDRSTGTLKPWLLKVARNILIDMARARKARPQETNDPSHDVPAVQDCTEQVHAALDLVSTLSELSAPHREVLMLLHYLDHSIPETARCIGVPTGTVKSRNFYALRELRRMAERFEMVG